MFGLDAAIYAALNMNPLRGAVDKLAKIENLMEN